MGVTVIADNTSIKIQSAIATKANASGNRDFLIVTTAANQAAKVKITFYNGTASAANFSTGTTSSTVSPTVANTTFFKSVAANTTESFDFEVGPSTTFYTGCQTSSASIQIFGQGVVYSNSP